MTISKQNLELSAMKDELVDVKALYAPCPSQIKALKEHIARLDKELSLEIEVKEELDKRLAAEQRKEAELDAMLAIEKRKEADLEKHLNATKEKLAKEEKQLAEDKETFNRVYESKDAEIADLKKRLASTELKLAAVIKEHKPCASTIAGLRKTITELQLSRDTLKAAVDSKDAQLDEVKKMLGDQLMEVLMKLLVEHRDMKVQLESITKKHDDCECRTAALQDELAELKKEPESNMRFA